MNWFKTLKAEVEFVLNPARDKPELAGAYGQYNRKTNIISINLAAFGEELNKLGIPYGEFGNEEMERIEAIMETLMHEGGHAAALGREYANLETEIMNWSMNRVLEHRRESNEELNRGQEAFLAGALGKIIDYLANEYIAAIIENPNNPPNEAMKNAFDQTIGAMSKELGTMIHFLETEVGEDTMSGELPEYMVMNMLFDAPTGWEFQNALLPFFNKYFKNVDKVIFDAFKEGMANRSKNELTEIFGDELDLPTRGSQLEPQYLRQLRGRGINPFK